MGTEGGDVDVDTEMADTSLNTSTTANGVSASNPDPDLQDSQPPATAAQQNRKDATLREFLSKMDDYAPIIPDAVTAHYLTLAGLPPPSPADPTGASTNTTPLPLARLLALATQKFVAVIAADAYQYSRIRASNSASANNPLGNAALGGAGAGPSSFGAAGAAGGTGAGKAQQTTQLGVQRSGYGG